MSVIVDVIADDLEKEITPESKLFVYINNEKALYCAYNNLLLIAPTNIHYHIHTNKNVPSDLEFNIRGKFTEEQIKSINSIPNKIQAVIDKFKGAAFQMSLPIPN